MAFQRKPWTTADDGQLKELAKSGLNRIEIARLLQRSIAACEVRASKLGIRLASATGVVPTDKNSSTEM